VIKSDRVYTDGNVEERCRVVGTLCDDADTRISVGDAVSCTGAVSTSEVATSDVATAAPCDAEFVSSASVVSSREDAHQTNVAAATHDISSQLNLGSILAESFISSTQSVAGVISTQATIGSPLIAAETLTSSDLRTSAAGI